MLLYRHVGDSSVQKHYVFLVHLILVNVRSQERLGEMSDTQSYAPLKRDDEVSHVLVLFAGFLYDYTQTYDCSFYLAGFCYLLSSLSLFLEPLAQRWTARKKVAQTNRAESGCKTNGCFTLDRLQNGVV